MALTVHIGLLLALLIFESLASKPDLYYYPASCPCRIVMMTLKALEIDVNMKEINIISGEQFQPDFIKLNPRHTVPTLDDNGFVLTERYVGRNFHQDEAIEDFVNLNRAIAAYLADSSPKGERFYPKDLKKRARINEMLYFDISRLYQDHMDLFEPMLRSHRRYDQQKADRLDEAFKFLDHYLGQSEWAAGNDISLADISLVATVSTSEACNFDVTKYPNVAKWYEKCKSLIPGYAEANFLGAEMMRHFFQAATSSS